MSNKSKVGYLARSSEGRFWHILREEGAAYIISVIPRQDNIIRIRKIKKLDYARKECYPSSIPCFRLEADI